MADTSREPESSARQQEGLKALVGNQTNQVCVPPYPFLRDKLGGKTSFRQQKSTVGWDLQKYGAVFRDAKRYRRSREQVRLVVAALAYDLYLWPPFSEVRKEL